MTAKWPKQKPIRNNPWTRILAPKPPAETAEIPRGSDAFEKKLNAAAAAGVQDAIDRESG